MEVKEIKKSIEKMEVKEIKKSIEKMDEKQFNELLIALQMLGWR